MATRSTIAVQHTNGAISQIYCHWDGYISNNGVILNDHYTTLEIVEELVSGGSLSSLNERIKPLGDHSFDNPESNTCVYYGRDRGEDELDVAPNVFSGVEHYCVNLKKEGYNYLFTNGEWLVDGVKLVDEIKKINIDNSPITVYNILNINETREQTVPNQPWNNKMNNAVSTEEKAIKISIRHHFCDVQYTELEVYAALADSDAEDDSDFPYVVWMPFADMSNGDLWDSVENLKNDIMLAVTL